MAAEVSSGRTNAVVGRGNGRSLLYVIKQLELAVRAQLDEIVRSAGITALQYTALTVLDHHDGLSLAQLARDSFVTPQAAADLVANLERRELVRRDRNPVDRREVVVSLTADGRQILADRAGAVQQLERQMIESLDENEARTFRSLLDRCRTSLARDES
jgi:DNA-binding MarR family transcriptional regulator